MAASKTDARIDKRKVTMRSVRLLPSGETATEEATDYVGPDYLDAYVADAQTRWQHVAVSDEPDAGPGGYDGATFIPAAFSGVGEDVTLPATGEST